jgi:PAS domain S-box-containing protein
MVIVQKMSREHSSETIELKGWAESSNYMRAILDSLEDELLVIDRDYKILDVNKAVVLGHGISREEIIGENCYEFSHGLPEVCCPPYHECPIRTAWETGKACRVTHVHVYDGVGGKKEKYLDIIASPIMDREGKVIAVAELMRDITAAKELELKITEAHQNLLALNTIAIAVSQSLDLDTVLNTALKKTLEIMKLNTGCILLWDEARQSLCYKVHRGLSEEYVDAQFCSLGEGIAGKVARTGKATLIEEIPPDAKDVNYNLAFTEGLRAVASIPLISREKVLGVLSIASRESREFSSKIFSY